MGRNLTDAETQIFANELLRRIRARGQVEIDVGEALPEEERQRCIRFLSQSAEQPVAVKPKEAGSTVYVMVIE